MCYIALDEATQTQVAHTYTFAFTLECTFRLIFVFSTPPHICIFFAVLNKEIKALLKSKNALFRKKLSSTEVHDITEGTLTLDVIAASCGGSSNSSRRKFSAATRKLLHQEPTKKKSKRKATSSTRSDGSTTSSSASLTVAEEFARKRKAAYSGQPALSAAFDDEGKYIGSRTGSVSLSNAEYQKVLEDDGHIGVGLIGHILQAKLRLEKAGKKAVWPSYVREQYGDEDDDEGEEDSQADESVSDREDDGEGGMESTILPGVFLDKTSYATPQEPQELDAHAVVASFKAYANGSSSSSSSSSAGVRNRSCDGAVIVVNTPGVKLPSRSTRSGVKG